MLLAAGAVPLMILEVVKVVQSARRAGKSRTLPYVAAGLDTRAAIGPGFVAFGNLPVSRLRILARFQPPVAKAVLAIDKRPGDHGDDEHHRAFHGAVQGQLASWRDLVWTTPAGTIGLYRALDRASRHRPAW